MDRGRRPQLDFAFGKINPLKTLLQYENSFATVVTIEEGFVRETFGFPY